MGPPAIRGVPEIHLQRRQQDAVVDSQIERRQLWIGGLGPCQKRRVRCKRSRRSPVLAIRGYFRSALQLAVGQHGDDGSRFEWTAHGAAPAADVVTRGGWGER